jgi:ABC-type cobalamin/Fe3+-siderophores transport system ATPase subunit
MLERLYVHNFRCLENFEFAPGNRPSALLVGKNGSGKSTLAQALAVFQRVGRGVNRVGQLVTPSDFALGRVDVPMRFELQLRLDGRLYAYILALELPERFKELRVLEEALSVDNSVIYSREHAQVKVHKQPEAQFNIDWHLVALTVIQDPAAAGALGRFRQWLASIVLLAPVPQLITGDAAAETLEPVQDASNLADWLAGLLAQYPAAYATISEQLKQVMPDLADFRFERAGKETKAMLVRFKAGHAQHELSFDALSDGEKCFFLCAVVLAANQCYGPLFAFWDEPDNYLSMNEVSQFVMSLRRGFDHRGGQILMSSHNEEAVRRFSHDTTWVLGRKSHLEPTVMRLLEDLPPTSDLIQSLLAGEVEP